MSEEIHADETAVERASTERGNLPAAVAEHAKDVAKSQGFQAQMFKAIAVQRPLVMEYLRSVRRDKPDASPADVLKELDNRYVASVTLASSGVGASAMIPGVGIPVALVSAWPTCSSSTRRVPSTCSPWRRCTTFP
ncbi:hypothetical protein [Agrococcus sp. KRD186]|uniref:hypothetical protein n=1 Tax=Agrococcus sp. KRD186 TaxID=2729730 RepID=UPI0019D2490F|nr:hypothetical protein [Agrococcus sp. KRD186]